MPFFIDSVTYRLCVYTHLIVLYFLNIVVFMWFFVMFDVNHMGGLFGQSVGRSAYVFISLCRPIDWLTKPHAHPPICVYFTFYISHFLEYHNKRIRYNLKLAIKRRDRDFLQKAMADFKKANLPDDDQDLPKAERILKEFKARDGTSSVHVPWSSTSHRLAGCRW